MSSRGGHSRVVAKALASRPSDLSIAKRRPIVKPSLVFRCGTSGSLGVNCRSLAVAGPLALAVLTATAPRPDGMLQIPLDPLTPSSNCTFYLRGSQTDIARVVYPSDPNVKRRSPTCGAISTSSTQPTHPAACTMAIIAW